MRVRERKLALPRAVAVAALGGWIGLAAMAGEPAEVRACLSAADSPIECVGTTVDDCVALPGGETTAGMVACIAAESAAWDEILNDEYQATMSALRAADAMEELAPPDLTRERALREAQRAWVAFRDAECRAHHALWGGGTLRQVVGANCVMVETAERAIELRQMRGP